MYYLDTNTCIYFLNGTFKSLLAEFKLHKPEDIKIPSLVKAELLLGVEKSQRKEMNKVVYNKFLEPFEVISFDDESAVLYAKIRAELEKKGKPIGPNDLIIAATVMSRKGILITHNTKEFTKISGLHIEDWAREDK
ncbi:MAG: type II toxin-antitoxin system VapC family toxin [Clostridia bacterium]